MRSTLVQTGVIKNITEAPEIIIAPEDDNMKYMLHTIQSFFVDAGVNGEQNFDVLYERLTHPKYGIGLKIGVIPIYIAVVIHLNHSNLVIKKGNMEQKITADLLNDINENSGNYSVVLENWNEEKTLYLSQLEQLFEKHIHEQEKVYNSFAYIVSAMNRWYMSLPKYAKEMTKIYKGNENFKTISASHRKFVSSLKRLDINPREYLFEKVFVLFGFKEFSADVVDNITQTKKEYDSAIVALNKALVSDVKIIFTPKNQQQKFRQ